MVKETFVEIALLAPDVANFHLHDESPRDKLYQELGFESLHDRRWF